MKLSGVEVPDEKDVLHRCDNPPCCNPSHLYIGDDKQNVKDMYDRGRGVVGSQHPLSKLTEDDVRKIRALVADGQSNAATARQFGVTDMVVGKIIRGISWKHVV